MKLPTLNAPLRLILLIVWGALSIILTTQSDHVPLVHFMTHTIGSTEIGATIGHAGLFAILTYAVYLMFALWLSRPLSLGLAMLVVIALGPITEWSQMGLFGRTPSLMDLLADWLGATMLGFAVSFWFMLRLQKVINMVEFSRSR